MSAAEREAERRYEVEPGYEYEECPLCGIHRRLAGYNEATCGENFREPGCFVAALAAVEGDEAA